MAEPTDNSTEPNSFASLNPTGEGVVIDIGTGDGTFVYQSAKRNPRKFYIGVDPSPRPLEKISEKIHRKPSKGGLPNALFVQAAIESLPEELEGVADEVHIHFPWGSLLQAVATGENRAMGNLRRICAPDALLEVVVGLDPERDRSEIQRLGLPPMDLEYIDSVLVPAYRNAGFVVIQRGVLAPPEWSQMETAWAKRLGPSAGRTVSYLVSRAVT